MAQISCRDLSVGHEGRTVVEKLNFEINEGDYLCIIGENGSGKTTLMKTLAGQVCPISGSFLSGGEVVMVPTRIPKVKGFTVREFILTGMAHGSGTFRKPGPEAVSAEEEAVRLLGLQQIESKDLCRISDGEFQKACTAIALVRRANVILLDEPTAFLDVDNRIMVLSVLREISRSTGTTVLFSTHDINDGAIYSDYTLNL